MTSKNKIVKSSTTGKDLDYTLYKYFDIETLWIICEGYLNYRSIQIKLLNISQFAIYYVVLAKIPTEDQREVMGIYLYRNQKHKPSYFFQLNEYERISDHCSKPLKTSFYLFELIGRDHNDIEIFGANDAIDREKWVKHIHQALVWTKQSFVSNSLPRVLQGPRRSWKEDSTRMEDLDADVRTNYEPNPGINQICSLYPSSQHLICSLTSAISYPGESYNNDDCYSNVLATSPSPTVPISEGISVYSNAGESIPENIYHEISDNPQSFLAKKNHLSEMLSRKFEGPTSEDQPLVWKDIFYSNETDDHARVLNNISQIGAFLVRPQSKQTNSNTQEYTLSIYTFGGIIKYRILKFPNGRYSLVLDTSHPNFPAIADLCRYYTKHHLPRVTSTDDPSKGSVGYLMLKWPYTYYSNQGDKF